MVNNKLYMPVRVKDFTEFITEMVNGWNKKYTDHLRSDSSKNGIAVTSIATYTYSWASLPQYSTIVKGDMVSFGAYPGLQGKHKSNYRVNKPWTLKLGQTGAWAPLDFTRPYRKPAVIYETNYINFSVYDAELPWLLSLFSSWQNINGVFFYFWNAPLKQEQSVPYGKINSHQGARKLGGMKFLQLQYMLLVRLI